MQLHASAQQPGLSTGNVVSMFRPKPQSKADGVFAAVNMAARDLGVKNHLAYQYARQAKKDYIAGSKKADQVVADWVAVLRKITERVQA